MTAARPAVGWPWPFHMACRRGGRWASARPCECRRPARSLQNERIAAWVLPNIQMEPTHIAFDRARLIRHVSRTRHRSHDGFACRQ